MPITTGDPQGFLDYQSEDYQEISSKLDAQICEETPGQEEKVCCRREDGQVGDFLINFFL